MYSVIEEEGIDRAQFLLSSLSNRARIIGSTEGSNSVSTPYCNTISPSVEDRMPWVMFMESVIRGIVRWNAMALVLRSMFMDPSIGGHISTFSLAATF